MIVVKRGAEASAGPLICTSSRALTGEFIARTIEVEALLG